MGAVAPDDMVGCSATGGMFADEDVANGINVTANITLTGPNADNYTVPPTAMTTANITPLPVTGTYSAANKPYDGTTTAALSAPTVVTPIGGDIVSLTGGVGNFNNATVGMNKPVTVTGASLTGADAANYMLGAVTANNADISPIPVTATITVMTRPYNGGTSATITGCTMNGTVGMDVVTCDYSMATAMFSSALLERGRYRQRVLIKTVLMRVTTHLTELVQVLARSHTVRSSLRHRRRIPSGMLRFWCRSWSARLTSRVLVS